MKDGLAREHRYRERNVRWKEGKDFTTLLSWRKDGKSLTHRENTVGREGIAHIRDARKERQEGKLDEPLGIIDDRPARLLGNDPRQHSHQLWPLSPALASLPWSLGYVSSKPRLYLFGSANQLSRWPMTGGNGQSTVVARVGSLPSSYEHLSTLQENHWLRA